MPHNTDKHFCKHQPKHHLLDTLELLGRYFSLRRAFAGVGAFAGKPLPTHHTCHHTSSVVHLRAATWLRGLGEHGQSGSPGRRSIWMWSLSLSLSLSLTNSPKTMQYLIHRVHGEYAKCSPWQSTGKKPTGSKGKQ